MASLKDIKMWQDLPTISKDNFKTKTIKTLLRQSARYTAAAEQDKNPMIALLHANYGIAYLWALRDIANDNDIKAATNIDIHKFVNKVTNIQDKLTKKVSGICPSMADNGDKYLLKLAGDL
tara:strand:- start:192 stop:554 length:363 start_codon:yes stop_codon:yes gene_type:complete